jgi:CheY-like chemotaxis protein
VLGKQLEKAGCVVHIANNGVEALSVLTTANSQRRKEKRDVKVDVVL